MDLLHEKMPFRTQKTKLKCWIHLLDNIGPIHFGHSHEDGAKKTCHALGFAMGSWPFSGVEVIVHESNDVAVTVRAKGIGTPVMCRESLPGWPWLVSMWEGCGRGIGFREAIVVSRQLG